MRQLLRALAVCVILVQPLTALAKGEEERLAQVRRSLVEARKALGAHVGAERRGDLLQLQRDLDMYGAFAERLRDRTEPVHDRWVRLRDLQNQLAAADKSVADARNPDFRADAEAKARDLRERVDRHKRLLVDPAVAEREELVGEGIRTYDQLVKRVAAIKSELDTVRRSDSETRRLLTLIRKLEDDARWLKDVLKRGPAFLRVERIVVPRGTYTESREKGAQAGSWRRVVTSSTSFKDTHHYIRNGQFESHWEFKSTWGDLPYAVTGGQSFQFDVECSLEISTHLDEGALQGPIGRFEARAYGVPMTTDHPNGITISNANRSESAHYEVTPRPGSRRFTILLTGRNQSITFVYER